MLVYQKQTLDKEDGEIREKIFLIVQQTKLLKIQQVLILTSHLVLQIIHILKKMLKNSMLSDNEQK